MNPTQQLTTGLQKKKTKKKKHLQHLFKLGTIFLITNGEETHHAQAVSPQPGSQSLWVYADAENKGQANPLNIESQNRIKRILQFCIFTQHYRFNTVLSEIQEGINIGKSVLIKPSQLLSFVPKAWFSIAAARCILGSEYRTTVIVP